MPARRLPPFIEPMLATLHAPFESDRHVYEIKWDGFRALAFNDAGGLRLMGRRKTDYTARFPELSPLAGLANGTVLDGEIVQIKNGRPDFSALLKRERSWSSAAKPTARRFPPVTFIAFDVLYDRYTSVMSLPLLDRQQRLAKIVAEVAGPRIALSDVHRGNGLALFDQVNAQGLEGVIAKRIDSVYEPGQRSGSWVKFKRRQSEVFAVIGYQLNATNGLKSLLLAAEIDGRLRFVGKVGSGGSPAVQQKLLHDLATLPARQPAVPATVPEARWVMPGLFCRVSFAEWTNDRKLRQPVFETLV